MTGKDGHWTGSTIKIEQGTSIKMEERAAHSFGKLLNYCRLLPDRLACLGPNGNPDNSRKWETD